TLAMNTITATTTVIVFTSVAASRSRLHERVQFSRRGIAAEWNAVWRPLALAASSYLEDPIAPSSRIRQPIPQPAHESPAPLARLSKHVTSRPQLYEQADQALERLPLSIRFGGWPQDLLRCLHGSTRRTGCSPSSADRPGTFSFLHRLAACHWHRAR